MNKYILTLCLTIGFTHIILAAHLSDRLSFSARLKPLKSIQSGGNGVAAFMLNNSHDTLFTSISVAKLSSPLVSYLITKNGTIVLNFDRKVLGNTLRTYITGQQLKQLLPDLINGLLEITVPSQKFPKGELQATIQLETDWAFSCILNSQETESNSTQIGHGNIVFGMNADTLVLKIATTLSNTITGVFLSKSGNRQDDVLLDLTELIRKDNNNNIYGGWKLNSREWDDIAQALLSNQLHLILATNEFAKGEISGLLEQKNILQFDGWKTDSAMHYTTNIALNLNATFDSAFYTIFYDGIDIKSLEIFFANKQQSELKQLSVGNNIVQGVWTIYDDINPLTPTIVNQLLKGEIRLTLKNSDDESKTINITKLAREGFIAELSNRLNETESGGQGTAISSYDRDRKNIHCMFAFDGLMGDLKETHISFGKRGEQGSIEMSTEPFTNNGSYKYLRTEDIFAKTQNLKISKKENTYIIIETTEYEDGEISGLFKWDYKTSMPTEDTTQFAGLNEDLISTGSFKVFPNPTTNSIKVDLVAKVEGYSILIISNTNGEELVKQTNAIEKSKNTLDLDMSSLSPGIYFIELAINGVATSNTKVIKQ